jgi:NAD(P)-dependent dehydrogenase (short-subunit alcohol dehydrogenase family)
MREPTQKLAVVTGASRGIGRAVCVELARCGYFSIINYRSDQAGAAETLRRVEAEGPGGEIMQFDVADADATQSAVERIIERHASIDVLVNNAGITADELFVLMSRKNWHAVIDTSLHGFYNITRPVIEKMVGQREGRRRFEVSPQHAARVVVKAVEAAHPRPRYFITIPAHVGAWSKRLLSDRMVERMMKTFYGMRSAEAAGKAER